MIERNAHVLWRVSPGRVHARPVAGRPIEISGPAAQVWLVLDEPGDIRMIAARLAEAGTTVADDLLGEAMHLLLDAQLAVERSG
jgi:hypothetical protein